MCAFCDNCAANCAALFCMLAALVLAGIAGRRQTITGMQQAGKLLPFYQQPELQLLNVLCCRVCYAAEHSAPVLAKAILGKVVDCTKAAS